MVDNFKIIFDMLPAELQPEENATNIKKLLVVYSKYCDDNDELTINYSELLDIYKATDRGLDFIGYMFATFREQEESDDDYRDRIIKTLINRKTPTTIPEIQQAIDAITRSGNVDVKENWNGKPANIYLTGTAKYEDIKNALNISKSFLPAGVYVIVPVVSFKIWQSIKDQFDTWQSLMDRDYIW